ncbi:hypothetical protein ABT404_43795, partial [Streptomyces hyaluromycini]
MPQQTAADPDPRQADPQQAPTDPDPDPTPDTRQASPRRPPAAPGPGPGGLVTIPEDTPPPSWIGDDLDRRRPPRLDRDLTPPELTARPAAFTDGTRLPVYMGDMGALGSRLDLPEDVLRRSFAFGQSDRVLRGADLVVEELGRRLGEAPGIRPAASRTGFLGRTGLLDDVRRGLVQSPQGFFGDGRRFVYRTEGGSTRMLTVTARPYERWERFAFGHANPAKNDVMVRDTRTTGVNSAYSNSTSLLPSVPLGPVRQLLSGWVRFSAQLTKGKRVQYNMQNQVLNQTESRTMDGSHPHLAHVRYEFAVTDKNGRAVGADGRTVRGQDTGQSPVAFGFAVRNGLAVRLGESYTRGETSEDRTELPEVLHLGPDTSYRTMATEAYGPLAHVRDWVLARAKVTPDSDTGARLSEFFSTDSFHTMGKTFTTGPVTTPALFRDATGRDPIGVFSVRVESGRAVLLDGSKLAELRDIQQTTLRNERAVTKSAGADVAASAGPAFQFLDLPGGAVNVRLLAGANIRYGASRSRTFVTGGTGAVKSATQVKGDLTGLYLVEKVVRVTAPPDTRAPLAKDRPNTAQGPAKLRKNSPRSWSRKPETREFRTWSLERLPLPEARRLAEPAGPRQQPPGAEPAAPPYLTKDRPPTLGMSHVEEFTFADDRHTHEDGDGTHRTLPEHFADQVLRAVAQAYPDLVAPLDELDPRNPRWRDGDHFQLVLGNTQEVLNTLAYQNMAGNLERMTTTGLPIALVGSSRTTRERRYVWVDAMLSERRYEGLREDLRLRYSAPGSENLAGQQAGTRGLQGGVEAVLSTRDQASDDIGAPLHAGTVSLGASYGRRAESESGYGSAASHEAMSIGTKGSHLYSYQLTLTAKRGGFRRPRGLLRGPLLLNLLGTQPFVLSEPETDLIGGNVQGTREGGPVTGRVLLSIPVEHVPTEAAEPWDGTAADVVRMERHEALGLALAEHPPAGRGTDVLPAAFGRHPHQTIAVVADPAITRSVEEVLGASSDGSWLLTRQGAPAHDAALRVFQSQYLTANFDQTSTAAGWRVSGLWSKKPYLDRTSVVAHRTRILPDRLVALTRGVTVDTETTVGGSTTVSGRDARTSTVFVGGQLAYQNAHGVGPGVVGTYGLAASPYRLDRSEWRTVTRTAIAEMTRRDANRHVLVVGDVAHEIAAASSVVGESATRRRLLEGRLAGVAGRRVTVERGWMGHIPERSAYRLGLLKDSYGDVPRYDQGRSWSPQPWLLDHPFGSFPVNSLDATAVLSDFDGKLRPLGLSATDRDTIHRLVSARVARALGKEQRGAGSSVPARLGRWGSETVGVWVGHRPVRVRAELVPVRVARQNDSADGPGFGGLGHSVELEEPRHAVETVQQGRSRVSGRTVGTTVAMAVHVHNDTVRAAGPALSTVGITQRGITGNRSEGSVRIATTATSQAHGEYVTRYRLRLTAEVSGRAPIRSEGEVGDLVEHYPLSLMRPDPAGTAAATPDDRLAPPALPVHGGSRRVDVPRTGAGGWHDVRHPGDGTTKPFALPEDGFRVRRIVGLEALREANTVAMAAAYDTSFPLTGDLTEELLDRAGKTPLTAPGSGAAQNLEDGTGNSALTAFYDRTLTAGGYDVPGLDDRGFLGGSHGDLRLYSRPDFGNAQLLAVADGMKFESPRRDVNGVATSAARQGATQAALGGGPFVSSQSTGTTQMTAGPADNSADSDALAAGGDRLTSVNVKPGAVRTFLFAIPTTWLSVAEVRHHVKDSRLGSAARSVFGHPRRGPQARETDTTVLAWVREDVARTLGLIDDSGFPKQVAEAWDAVTEADKEWTAADKKYWDLRRDNGDRYDRELSAAEQRSTAAQSEVTAAEEAIARLDAEDAAGAEPAHGDWADLHDLERRSAQERLADARREVADASAVLDTALARQSAFADTLRAHRDFAEALAEEYARVREATDRLTRWHQLHATADGRGRLGSTPEPDAVAFEPPAAPKPEEQAEQEKQEKPEEQEKDGGEGSASGKGKAREETAPEEKAPEQESPRAETATAGPRHDDGAPRPETEPLPAH